MRLELLMFSERDLAQGLRARARGLHAQISARVDRSSTARVSLAPHSVLLLHTWRRDRLKLHQVSIPTGPGSSGACSSVFLGSTLGGVGRSSCSSAAPSLHTSRRGSDRAEGAAPLPSPLHSLLSLPLPPPASSRRGLRARARGRYVDAPARIIRSTTARVSLAPHLAVWMRRR